MIGTTANHFLRVLVFAIIAATVIHAQEFQCLDVFDGNNPLNVCNTTDLQRAWPKKACYRSPLEYIDISLTCADTNFNFWQGMCPKKNLNVEDFCGGTGFPQGSCLLTPCETAEDCGGIIAPQTDPIALKQCYYCCQTCHDDTYCDQLVLDDSLAARGDTTCAPCDFSPSCENGHVELSTGFCNCYSGFTNDRSEPLRLCSVPPAADCLPLPEPSPLKNTDVPFLNNLDVRRDKLRMSIGTPFVAGRRTLIEFPNPACNLINSPQYYDKTTNGCTDVYSFEVPYIECGFVKTSATNGDKFRGQVLVKHIDSFVVDGQTIERSIDTPFPIGIRLPTSITASTRVEIIATPVSTVLKAVIIGQTVNVTDQTAQITLLTSAPAPLYVVFGMVNTKPSGVSAGLRIIDERCGETSSAEFCQQKLAIVISNTNCQISGVYNLTVRVGCTTPQHCPIGMDEYPSVNILVEVMALPTCGESFVDVNLLGYLTSFNDSSFTKPTPSFKPGARAYFLLDTYADVDIASVNLRTIFFAGAPSLQTSLLYDGNVTSLAAASSFSWGRYSNSQAWFAFDVAVSSRASSAATLFKLDPNESGVYAFVAAALVEWTDNNGVSGQKRIVFEGRFGSQNSQFSGQLQVGNAQKDDEATSNAPLVSIPLLVVIASVVQFLF